MPKPPDDRDVRKPITPPIGVRAQTAPENFEENTPVDGDPVTQLRVRSRQAAHNSREAAVSAKASFAKLSEVQREVQGYVERDQQDHERLFNGIDRLDGKLDAQNNKIDAQNDKIDRTNQIVGNLRGEMGKVSGQLTILTGALEEERRARNASAQIRTIAAVEVEKHAKITTIEVQKQEQLAEIEVSQEERLAEISTKKAAAAFRRKKNLKLIGYIGSVISLIGALIAAVQC